jgi:hypothetical protein
MSMIVSGVLFVIVWSGIGVLSYSLTPRSRIFYVPVGVSIAFVIVNVFLAFVGAYSVLSG